MTVGGKTMFLTVGTGTTEDLCGSLLIPLKKSILKGKWEEVVLLPSQETAHSARLICDELQDVRLTVSALPEAGQENNADQAYAHFEKVIAERIARGISPVRMVADFTRGTKAMSAALVLAAARHGIPKLRYITGQRNSSGSVRAGTEVVSEFATSTASGHRLLDQARLAMEKGNFAAVLDILPVVEGAMAGVWPEDIRSVSRYARGIAAFYGAWDRLDYAEAAKFIAAGLPDCTDSIWAAYAPSSAVIRHVQQLAAPRQETCEACAAWVRLKTIDLLANGERRVRDRQFEDAYLRAYRVLELLGQVRLFAHGLDSGQLPKDHPAVDKLRRKLEKNRESMFGVDRKTGNFTAPRELAARLLKSMGDPMGERLLLVGAGGLARARNKSLLIHGFEATRLSADKPLSAIYADLEGLLLEESSEAASALAVARCADLRNRQDLGAGLGAGSI